MKKFLCAIAMLVAASANADVLDFENIATSYYDPIGANSVQGALVLSSNWFVGNTTVDSYQNAAHSGTNYLSNGNNNDNLSISSAAGFTFNGAWFATPTHSSPAEWINITAYDAMNNVIGSTGNVAIGVVSQYVAANFSNVHSLNITRGDGWFTMDDFTFNADAVDVPEPASLALFGLGLTGFAAARRRKQ